MYYQIDGDSKKFPDNLRGLSKVLKDAMDIAQMGATVVRKYYDDGTPEGWERPIPKQPPKPKREGWNDISPNRRKQ